MPLFNQKGGSFRIPRHPVIFSADEEGLSNHRNETHSIHVPLPFSEGDWIPRESGSQVFAGHLTHLHLYF